MACDVPRRKGIRSNPFFCTIACTDSLKNSTVNSESPKTKYTGNTMIFCTFLPPSLPFLKIGNNDAVLQNGQLLLFNVGKLFVVWLTIETPCQKPRSLIKFTGSVTLLFYISYCGLIVPPTTTTVLPQCLITSTIIFARFDGF
jgi:hypothetical protein